MLVLRAERDFARTTDHERRHIVREQGYDYRVAGIAKIVDGDTFDLDLDLGFHATIRVRLRLADIDTAELGTALGESAAAMAEQWLQMVHEHNVLRVKTSKLRPGTPTGDGSFGRWAGTVYDDATGELLADVLREHGHEKG